MHMKMPILMNSKISGHSAIFGTSTVFYILRLAQK